MSPLQLLLSRFLEGIFQEIPTGIAQVVVSFEKYRRVEKYPLKPEVDALPSL